MGDNPLDDWSHRRPVIYLVLTWCALNLTWLTFRADDNPLHQQEASMYGELMGAVLLGYLFAAVWSNKGVIREQFTRQYPSNDPSGSSGDSSNMGGT